MGGDYRENLFRILSQKISNRMAAFDYKGGVLRSHVPIKEELTNVRPLRARQEGE